MQCYDVDRKDPYPDEVQGAFDDVTYARYHMLCCVIDELRSLNGILEDDTFPELRFIATMEDTEHGVIIQAWDGPDYRPVTCYDVITVKEHLQNLNRKLKEIHGEHITVGVNAYLEDDGSIRYYYSSVQCGESDAFTRAVDAYEAANKYLSDPWRELR